MASLSTLIREATTQHSVVWQPRLYCPEKDARELEELLSSDRVAFVRDTIESQLGELVASRNPARRLNPSALAAAVREHLGGRSPETYGTYAYFAWSKSWMRDSSWPEASRAERSVPLAKLRVSSALSSAGFLRAGCADA